MKLRSLLPMAAFAALVLTGCSKDDVVAPNQEPTVTEGYATFKINLPSTPGSRAETYTDEGSAEEYAVKSIKFLIFEQEGSGDIKYKENADVTDDNWTNGSDAVISTNSKIVAKIGKISSAKNYYVVALINGSNVTLPTPEQTYTDWITSAQDAAKFSANSTNGFTMTNVVFSDGTNVNNGLVQIVNENIGRTETEAKEKGPAANIYVERVHAKVQASYSASYDVTVKNASGDLVRTDKVTFAGWDLDITNKTGFPVMNPLGISYSGKYLGYEFASPKRRLAWCSDPNYESYSDSNFDEATMSDWKASATVDYCLENTMRVDHMKKDAATRVIFKGNYTLQSGTEGETLYKFKSNRAIFNKANTEGEIASKATTALGATCTADAKDISSTGGGYYSLSEIATITKGGTEVAGEDLNTVAMALGLTNATAKEIAVYYNGEVYYPAYIRHFGDTELGGDNIGKYGVVRNNWYALTVTSISAIGEPERPGGDDIDPDPIDEEYSYLNVQINILKWAKRTQEVDL